MVKIAALLLPVVSANLNDWASKYCAVTQHAFSGEFDAAKITQEYGDLFADKIDCSAVPGNSEVGYDLKGATFSECNTAAMNSPNYAQAELARIGCKDALVDEAKGEVAIVWEVANTGKYTNKYKVEAVTTLKVEGGKAVSYHDVYDTFHFLNRGATPVHAWASKYCSTLADLTHVDSDDEAAVQKLTGDYTALFAAKMDCSTNPNNQVIGYDLKGASFSECAQAEEANAVHFKHMEMAKYECLEIIADEKDGTGAVWLQFGNTGKYTAITHVRAAMRFAVEGGVATSYHVVFDTANVLASVELASTPSSSVPLIAGAMGLVTVAFVAGMQMKNRKQAPLLENEVLA